MIPMIWFLHCGAPVEEAWEVEVFSPGEQVVAPQPAESQSPSSIGQGHWEDQVTGLTVAIPDGWMAWPGAPAATVRLHMEHQQSGLHIRVFWGSEPLEWPESQDCEWGVEERGISSGLRIGTQPFFANCWPKVPGAGKRIGWRFEQNEGWWLVEAKIPGGHAGVGDQALEALLPGMRF
jgi:hypothetical protein